MTAITFAASASAVLISMALVVVMAMAVDVMATFVRRSMTTYIVTTHVGIMVVATIGSSFSAGNCCKHNSNEQEK